MLSLETVQTEIRKVAAAKAIEHKKINRSKRQRRNIKLSTPVLRRVFSAVKVAGHNKHELIALIYKVPVLGGIFSFFAYSLRIHKHINGLREAIINCHFEISSAEIRTLQQSHQDFVILQRKIIELEKEISALKARQGRAT